MTDRLGRYVVLKHLASGGMADVLLARTDGIEGFERHVVLKRIRSEHAKDQRFIDMFLDEARLAANLHHQNIVQVHDIGESSGDYFFAMEYLHGEDVRSMLSKVGKAKTHMPLGHVVTIVSSVAAGLHYAHERRGPDKKPLNIVHRDVSPSNIIVGYDGSVKIVDFGIAKAAMRQVETQAGSLKGKVSYMSPEHCKGEPIDRRSDVYALGVVLYELATTTRLFKGDNDYLVMDAICNGKIPLPRVRRSDLPNELAMIITTALATDPNRRYQSADEMRQALEQFAVRQQITANSGAIATYLVKQFGERPEPWLDITASDRKSAGSIPTVANPSLARSWTELPASRDLSAIGDEDKTTTGGKSLRANPVAALSQPQIVAATKDRVEDRTSSRMAWEHEGALPPPPVAESSRFNVQKVAMFAAPALLLAILGVWKIAGGGGEGDRAVAASSTASEGMTVTPATAMPAPADPALTDKTVARPEPIAAAAPIVVAAAPEVVAPTKIAAPKVVAPKPAPARPAPLKVAAAKPEPEKAPVIPEPPKPAIVITKPIEAPPPVVVAPPPPPVPPPAPIEPQVARLSQGSIAGVASQHRRELSKCEGTEQLHGEITVSFAVNGAGRVVKSQLSSTLKNPKVSGCILRTLQSWQFPKPPGGAAEGSYSMSYQ